MGRVVEKILLRDIVVKARVFPVPDLDWTMMLGGGEERALRME